MSSSSKDRPDHGEALLVECCLPQRPDELAARWLNPGVGLPSRHPAEVLPDGRARIEAIIPCEEVFRLPDSVGWFVGAPDTRV